MNVAKEIENIKELLENNIQQKSAISSDTKKSIAVLEVNYKNIMDRLEEFQQQNKEAHNAITSSVSAMERKLDLAIDKKAEKSIVEKMSIEIEDLKSWKWKMIGISIVIVFLIYLLKDIILIKL